MEALFLQTPRHQAYNELVFRDPLVKSNYLEFITARVSEGKSDNWNLLLECICELSNNTSKNKPVRVGSMFVPKGL